MAQLHHVVEGTGQVEGTVEGAGRHVVLLHAGVADLRMWDAQVEVLVPGHGVVRCDLAGFGGTPHHTRPGGCHAEDVLLLLDERGVERFALVGASFGGYVALQIATAVPDRVDALVLLAAAADIVEPDDLLRAVWRREEELLENGDVDGATSRSTSRGSPLRQLLWSERMTSRSSALRLEPLVEGLPDARLVELAWAGHVPSLERPAETARLVAAALG